MTKRLHEHLRSQRTDDTVIISEIGVSSERKLIILIVSKVVVNRSSRDNVLLNSKQNESNQLRSDIPAFNKHFKLYIGIR